MQVPKRKREEVQSFVIENEDDSDVEDDDKRRRMNDMLSQSQNQSQTRQNARRDRLHEAVKRLEPACNIRCAELVDLMNKELPPAEHKSSFSLGNALGNLKELIRKYPRKKTYPTYCVHPDKCLCASQTSAPSQEPGPPPSVASQNHADEPATAAPAASENRSHPLQCETTDELKKALKESLKQREAEKQRSKAQWSQILQIHLGNQRPEDCHSGVAFQRTVIQEGGEGVKTESFKMLAASPEPPRSSSESETERARSVAPSASAGQAGIPAPQHMSERQLHDQCRVLVGKVVVYSLRPVGSNEPYKLHAGHLATSGERYEVRASVANNELHGVVQHTGPEQVYPLPADGYTYSRILDATVHQTEQAVNVIAGLKSEAALKDEQLKALQLQVTALLNKLEELTPQGSGMVAGNKAPAEEDNSKVVFPADADDVVQWADDIGADLHRLIYHLESRYLSGMAHLPGGEQLEEAFHSLRLWVMGVAYFDGWQGTPQLRRVNKMAAGSTAGKKSPHQSQISVHCFCGC
ncbi:hypothetical protein DIPPA_70091 [Diplonema papillatum]|nr:hypothetical protein DIPPA_70091 [Diplonema papillatum]